LGKPLRIVTLYASQILRSALLGRDDMCAERILCVGTYVAEQLARAYLVPSDRIRVVPNGIHLPTMPSLDDRLRMRQALRLPTDETLVLCVGRLARDKAFDAAIRAFAEARAGVCARLVIVGAGPEEDALKKLAADLLPEGTVVFVGRVPQDEVIDYYTACDILLLPSLRFEGHPYVLVEAAGAGLAVVGVNRGGVGKELSGKDLAILVRPGSVFELSEAICALLEDRALREALGRNLRRYAEQHYTMDAMLDQIEESIQEMANTGGCHA